MLKVKPDERSTGVFRLKRSAAVTDFHYQDTVGREMLAGIEQYIIYHVQAGAARRQGQGGFMPVFSRQCRHFPIGYIRRIADNYIIPAVIQCTEQV